MIRIIGICFAVGGAIGWFVAGVASPGTDAEAERGGRAASAADFPENAGDDGRRASLRIGQSREQVEVTRDRLSELLASRIPTAVNAGLFFARDGQVRSGACDALAKWVGLDEQGNAALHGILRQAAAARREWEAANVRVVPTGTHTWALHFPGDRGAARDELRRALREQFGPLADEIHLTGDLENFFGFPLLDPEFRQGVVEVFMGLSEDGRIDFHAAIGGSSPSVAVGSDSMADLRNDHVAGRFVAMIEGSGD
jgi:hypothetical protein